uniref:Uncharacterized protein n=1 Tax=Melopsittacus undulatus TaxID=13146 RepID=A0A8V5GBJ4_MELUD
MASWRVSGTRDVREQGWHARSCGSAAEELCNFICDCGNCSDENQCGYLQGSAVLGTSFTCDFEDGACGWQDVSTSVYRWVRNHASLAAWGTGPHSDHTLGTDLGWFMLTVSPPAKTTATAWLRSPVMQEAAVTCEIRAWYHISGNGEGSLVGTARSRCTRHRKAVMGGSGEGWGHLPPCTCSRGSCLAQHRFCDGTDDCGDGSDEDPMQCSEHAWPQRGVLPTGSSSHTDGLWVCTDGAKLGSGAVRALSSSSPAFESIPWLCCECSRLLLPWGVGVCSSPSHPQLVLYCHLHGSATSSLSISYVTNFTKHLVKERTGDLGSLWVRERVDFNVMGSFKVGTCLWDGPQHPPAEPVPGESTAGQSQESGPPCPTPSTALPSLGGAGPCAAAELACDSGECIAAELGCDFAATCADGSDETRCGATTFEEGPGGWHDVSVGQLRWGTVLSGEAAPPLRWSSGPQGAGLLLLPSAEGQMVAAAKARTPLLGPSGPACAMEMSYHIHSSPQGNHLPALGCPACTLPAPASEGHIHVLLGERSRPFQVLPEHRDQCGQLVNLRRGQAAEGRGHWEDLFAFWVPCPCSLIIIISLWLELSCNFEKGMCGWYQDQSSDFKWVRGTGQGQGSDHTTGSGYFLVADPSALWSRGQRALLITYLQEPAATERCLSFWYRLAGAQIGMQPPSRRQPGPCRLRTAAPFSSHHRHPEPQAVAFEALRDGFLGDMALDDLTLTAGPCGAELSCSFEADACGLVGSGWQGWLRQSNGTGTAAGPPADHTTGTAAGHYLVVSTGRDSLPTGHVAALTSQPYQPSAPAQCLAFWYQLSTSTPGSLRVFVEQSGVQRRVLSVSSMEGDAWHRGHATVEADGDWQVIFEAVGAGGDRGYIALDDLHVSDGACPEPASCDFEQDMCGWSSPTDPRLHSFAWGWKSGVPLTKYPGPEQDHTLGTKNGHYVHFDTSVLGPGGTTALLESQYLPAAADSCLQFWYHMDIPEHLSCGELRVVLQSAAGQRTLWSAAGHRGRGWQSGAVPVQSPGAFQVRGPPGMQGAVCGAGCHPALPAASLRLAERSPGSFVAETVVGVLLAIIILALAAAGGWCWVKRRGVPSAPPAEGSSPQGFDNITFRDVSTGVMSRLSQPRQKLPWCRSPRPLLALSQHGRGAKGSASYLLTAKE